MLSSAQVVEAENLNTEPPLPEPETKIEAILRRIADLSLRVTGRANGCNSRSGTIPAGQTGTHMSRIVKK